jgi:hypothetical protein
MNKQEKKALWRARQGADEEASAKSRERRIGEDPVWRGAGLLLFQLQEWPSFEPGSIWDIRSLEDTLTLYVSRMNPEKPGFLMPGYVKLDCGQARLKWFVKQMDDIQLGALFRFRGQVGCDGTLYELLRREGFASTSLRWWEEGPDEWKAFTGLVRGFIEELKQLKPVP